MAQKAFLIKKTFIYTTKSILIIISNTNISF